MKRPFKALGPGEEPAPHYDAVIIGAGVGGLMTAILLQDAGLKTLLVEQHYMVGGYCSSFSRKGYHFDAASHFYPLLGNENSLTGKLLKRFSIPTQWIKMDPVDHFHFPDGSRYSVPADFNQYLAELKARFPKESDHLDAFFKEVRSLYMLGLLAYFKGQQVGRIQASQGISLREALDQHFSSRELKLYLTADCPHWGSPPNRTSFIFDSMLRLSYFLGNYYPKGGSQAFADDLAARFEQLGGDILLRCDAERILTKDRRATGVRLKRGTGDRLRRHDVKARYVISNADMLQTVRHLINPEDLEPGYVEELESYRVSYPCYLMYIGLKDTRLEELYEAQGYHWREWDPDLFGTTGLKFKFFVPTMFDPGVAPAGGQIVIIQKAMQVDFDSIKDWPSHKAEIDAMVMRNLRRLIPGFDERVVVRLSASARTSHNYTRNRHGSMLGWEMAPDHLGASRPGVVGPLDGLYYVGHWTQPGGGITPVIVSATQAAGRITGNSYF